jgi:hypothetical protein
MSGKKEEAQKLSFVEVFAQSMENAKVGRLAMVMPVILHPMSRNIQVMGRASGIESSNRESVFGAWDRDDLPWMGAAVWALPASLEKEMIKKARCGALFSHANTDSSKDRAYIEHLGPVGAQVSGTQWNQSAFSDEGYPISVCVGMFDLSFGRADRTRMEGGARPSYWPEPLPMIKRVWTDSDPPERSPDFKKVALFTAEQMRLSVAEAIMEETDASPEQVEALLGGVLGLPNQVARHFARQEHGMFGAPKLNPVDHEESMLAMDYARAAFDRAGIERAAHSGEAVRGEGPRL